MNTPVEEVRVDPKVAYCGTKMINDTNNLLPLMREAAFGAAERMVADGREPVMVEVRIWVKPQ